MVSATASESTLTQRAAMAAASSLSTKTSYAAAAGTAFFGIEAEVWGVFAGILIAAITMMVNIYYQKKKHNLDVLLAHSQLERIADAAIDANQQALLDKLRGEFFAEFGDINKRKQGDRRQNSDPNYSGVERRKASRREGPSGDSDIARTMRIVAAATKDAVQVLEKRDKG